MKKIFKLLFLAGMIFYAYSQMPTENNNIVLISSLQDKEIGEDEDEERAERHDEWEEVFEMQEEIDEAQEDD